MDNLFWKTKAGKIVRAHQVPFTTEEEFERYVQTVKEILSDIFILKRQVRAGKDIPDMIGVDRDNNLVIIENKNVLVDEEILPQILRYAVWAETHPDAFEAMWFKAPSRPDDIDIDWDHLQIRVLVLAPSIRAAVPRLVKKIGYKVELIEIRKFGAGKEEFILVHRLEEPEGESTRGVRGLEIYDRAFYKEKRNPQSVDKFFALEKELEKITKLKRWSLEAKFNAYYVGFKYGFFNVFGVHWVGTKSFEIFVKSPKNQMRRMKRLCPYPLEYDDRWKQVTVRVTDDLKPAKLIPMLERGYETFVGKH